jgi:hypothetical protein
VGGSFGMVNWSLRAMSRSFRAMIRRFRAMCGSFRATGSFVRTPDVSRTRVERVSAVRVCDSTSRRRNTTGSARGCSALRRR